MASPGFPLGVGLKPASWGEFVALPENGSALTAARRLARALTRPDARPSPSPLVLHGPPGTGKSFLVRALVRKLTADPVGFAVQVLAAGDMPRPAADQSEPPEWADFRTCDLLVVEDAQHLAARSAGTLCRLLDDRAMRRHPTVVTATVGPAGLKHLSRRLTSRLTAGLVVQLEPIGPAGRRTLLEHLAAKRKVPLADDALDWLAARATGGGVWPLLGAVEKLAVLARGVLVSLDADAVRDLLAEPGLPAADPVGRIVAKVAAAFGVTPKDILGRARHRSVMVPRQVAMYLARGTAGLSLPQVGAAFGRDHTTVLHACRKVEADLKTDAKLKATVRELRAEFS